MMAREGSLVKYDFGLGRRWAGQFALSRWGGIEGGMLLYDRDRIAQVV